jgi:death-on-curing protein
VRPKWLDVSLVLAIHDEAVYEFGGLGGLRDRALLESAAERPRNRLAYEPSSTIFELAATLCFGLTKNHAFTDGNKRTALLATRAFLFLNGFALEPAEEDEVLTMIAVADGSLDEPPLALWLKRNSTRIRRKPSPRR